MQLDLTLSLLRSEAIWRSSRKDSESKHSPLQYFRASTTGAIMLSNTWQGGHVTSRDTSGVRA